jgi:hypothetical protein
MTPNIGELVDKSCDRDHKNIDLPTTALVTEHDKHARRLDGVVDCARDDPPGSAPPGCGDRAGITATCLKKPIRSFQPKLSGFQIKELSL